MSQIIQKVNGVTKLNTDEGTEAFIYYFPLATIRANNNTDVIQIEYKDGQNPVSTTYSDLDDDFGTTDAETYVDYLAENGFFFETTSTGVPQGTYNSTVNSTTTLLNAATTFTGTFEKSNAESLTVSVKTDQEGTLYIDFSPDGTNVDSTLSFNYQTNRIFVPVPLAIGGRYTRIRFTNDSATNQTYLRLETAYGGYTQLTSTLNGTIAENFAAMVVRPTDYRYEVAMGDRQGRMTWNKFGYNLDVDNSTPEIIASFGGTFAIMTTAATLDVVSDDTNDTSAGTGARTILLTGIDGDYLTQTEIVTMNGTTAVTTSNTWLGINRVVVLSSGTSDFNEGTITIDDTAGTVGTQAELPAEGSVTQQCIFHTQINHTFLADYLRFKILKPSGGGSGNGYVLGYSYSRVTETIYEVFREPYSTTSSTNTIIDILPSQPFVVGGREVLYFVLDSDANNVEIAGRFSGIEERIS